MSIAIAEALVKAGEKDIESIMKAVREEFTGARAGWQIPKVVAQPCPKHFLPLPLQHNYSTGCVSATPT
jgi:hypothetical protein